MDYKLVLSNTYHSYDWLKYLHSKSKAGQMKNPHLINNFIHTYTRFAVYNPLMEIDRKTLLNNFIIIKDVLTSKMGDMWDFFIDIPNCEVGVEMLFPELTIYNDKNDTHQLKDLLVKFEFEINSQGEMCFSKPSGFRLTRTVEEMSVKYSHSHLPTTTITSFSRFCIGNGTELDEFLSSLHFSDYEFSDIAIETYLYGIDSLVTYESIESTPYIEMRSISRAGNSLFKEQEHSYYENILDLIQVNTSLFNHDFKEGQVEIRKDKQLIDFLLSHLSEDTLRPYLYVVRGGNKYIPKTLPREVFNDTFMTDYGEPITHYIGGKPFKMSVIPGPNTEVNKENLHISDKFLEPYINILKQKFYENEVKKGAVARATTSNNA